MKTKLLLILFIFLNVALNAFAATKTLYPNADAYVAASTPSINYGSDNTVAISTSLDILAYVKFDLSTIPSGAIISSAKLRFYCSAITSNGAVSIARASSSWNETGITWNNRPGWNIPIVTSTPLGSSSWWEISVTSIAKEWIENGAANRGFYLEKHSNGMIVFYSHESSIKPQLVISYTTPNEAPTISMTQPANDTSVSPGGNVTVAWNGTDPDDQATVTVYYDTDTNLDNGGWGLICGGQPEDGSCSWDTSSVPLGTYYVIGVIDDFNHGSNVNQDVAAGRVTVGNEAPTISMTQPANDTSVSPGGNVTVAWNGTDPDDQATVTVYYDTDTNLDNGGWGLICGGQPEDGSCSWDTSSVPLGTYYVIGVIDDFNHGSNVNQDVAAGRVTVGNVSLNFTPPFVNAIASHSESEGARLGLTVVGAVPSDLSPNSGGIHHQSSLLAQAVGATTWTVDDRIRWQFSVPKTARYTVSLQGTVNGNIYDAGYWGIDDCKHWVAVGLRIVGEGGGIHELYNNLDTRIPTGMLWLTMTGAKAIISVVPSPAWLVYSMDVIDTIQTIQTIRSALTPVVSFNNANNNDHIYDGDLTFYADLKANTNYEMEFYAIGASVGGVTAGILTSAMDITTTATNITIEEISNAVIGPVLQVTPQSIVDMQTTVIGGSTTNSTAFTVRNMGDQMLNGNVSISPGPVQIISGAQYNLAPNMESQVSIRFTPSHSGIITQALSFSGGDGAERYVRSEAIEPLPVQVVQPENSIDFGYIPIGSTKDIDAFWIVNQGGGTLTGSVSVSPPFSIVSGESYNLAHGESQVVTIRFSPITVGTFNDNVIFTGGGGFTRLISGSGTNTVIAPIINSTSDQSIVEGLLYIGPDLTLIQGTQPVIWSLVNYPSGMFLDSDTGKVLWPNPNVSGSPHTITIRAANTAGYDEETWLLTVNSNFANHLIVDFGPNYGIWVKYDDGNWQQLHGLSPDLIVVGDVDGNAYDDLIVDFGPNYGIWVKYDDGNWQQLHGLSPDLIVVGDVDGNAYDDLIVDFGPNYGIWVKYDDGNWQQLHGLSPDLIVVGDVDGNAYDDLIVDFGPNYGIWVKYDDGNWQQLHGLSPDLIVVGDVDGNAYDDLIVDFGPNYGIWVKYDDGSWQQLHGLSPDLIVVGDVDGNAYDDLIVDFGPNYGIWVKYDDGNWQQLHGLSPDLIVVGDVDGNAYDDLIVDFGPNYGIWVKYDDGSWQQLHGLTCENIAVGDVDGN